MRTAMEIVNYLTRHYQEKIGEIEEDLLPERVNGLVSEMGEFLEARLGEETPYQAVWDAFVQSPEGQAASLAGVLEAVFEAQPGVRTRVDGYMQAITALETQRSDQAGSAVNVEDSLQSGVMFGDTQDTEAALIADQRQEKNPPVYLYGNARAGFESDQPEPVSQPFMVGKNAEIIYTPTEGIQLPFMFMQLGQLSADSTDLDSRSKAIVAENLDEIRGQLTGDRLFNEEKMSAAFDHIWEAAPTYADALVDSLQRHLDELPLEAQGFIERLNTTPGMRA